MEKIEKKNTDSARCLSGKEPTHVTSNGGRGSCSSLSNAPFFTLPRRFDCHRRNIMITFCTPDPDGVRRFPSSFLRLARSCTANVTCAADPSFTGKDLSSGDGIHPDGVFCTFRVVFFSSSSFPSLSIFIIYLFPVFFPRFLSSFHPREGFFQHD